MTATLSWNTFLDADCASFNLYRALTGLSVAFPNSLVSGDQLIFATNNNVRQLVTLSGATQAALISSIASQAKGLSAVLASDESTVLIRVTSSVNPRFQLFPCTFATHTAQTPRVVLPKHEYVLLANRVRVPETYAYTYTDVDGSVLDWYQLTSVSVSDVESFPSPAMKALAASESLCVVSGRVIDAQNRALVQAPVVAEIQPRVGFSDNSGLSVRTMTTTTDAYGRFVLPLLQGHTVLFRISSIGYNQVVEIPKAAYVLFRDLIPVNSQLFNVDSFPPPPCGNGSPPPCGNGA